MAEGINEYRVSKNTLVMKVAEIEIELLSLPEFNIFDHEENAELFAVICNIACHFTDVINSLELIKDRQNIPTSESTKYFLNLFFHDTYKVTMNGRPGYDFDVNRYQDVVKYLDAQEEFRMKQIRISNS